MNVSIRPASADEAEAIWNMMYALDQETTYMLYEPNERVKNIDRIKSVIQDTVEGSNLFLIAKDRQTPVGYISAQKGSLNKIRHSAYIVIGIRAAYRNQGIGTRFFKELDLWAKNNQVTRLELTVMCPNLAARSLYEKNGFVIEGTKKNAIFSGGVFTDEYYMAKLL